MEKFDLFNLEHKVIVLTGSTGGLGKTFVREIAKTGATLAILDRVESSDSIDDLVDELRKEGVTINGYVIDMSDESQIESVKDNILNDFGHIDGLLNIAGINQHGPVEEYSIEDLERLMNVNVAGTFAVCKHFGKVMCEQGSGSIVNIASIAASVILRIPRNMSGYSISKAGVVQMSKALAAEFGEHNVRVNSIAPGFMETRMSGTKGAIQADPEVIQTYIKDHTPIQRACRADELVGAALYYLSDASTFTTGTNLVIDGGYTIL